MAGVGVKAGNGQRVTELLHRPGQQRDRLLAQLQDGLRGARHGVIERVGEVQKHQYGNVAPVGAVAQVDAGVGLATAFQVNQ